MNQEQLIEKYGPPPALLTNRIIIQLYKDTAKLPSITSANWLLRWIDNDDVAPKVLRSKIHYVAKKAAKLRGAALQKFNDEFFQLPDPELVEQYQPTSPSVTPSNESLLHSSPPQTSSSISSGRPHTITTPRKRHHLQAHDITKKQKQVKVLEQKLQQLKEQIICMQEAKGHYSMKNVRKREERSVEARKVLKKELLKLKAVSGKQKEEIDTLKECLHGLKLGNVKMQRKLSGLRKTKKKLMKQRRMAIKRANYHNRRRNMGQTSQIQDMDEDAMEVDSRMEIVDTKTETGEYTEATRLGVMQLVGLEVATAKVGAVMEVVGEMAGIQFTSLPSKTACQRMVDEGQELMMCFLREDVLKKSAWFGIHKDGTTRKKVKILDTSVRTDAGEEYCLGWSSVVSETGTAIAEETKAKFGEVAGALSEGDKEDVTVELLKKLEYFMNDRAANEKKSSRLLDDWRNEVLESQGEDATVVQHLYCAAHVLLGFHSYVISSIKKLDFLPCTEIKHPVMVLLRDASDLFGPVGDYRGMRNEWEAMCATEGKKSWIQSYKDNRFNGLFEVAAQVFHHHSDFLKLLETHSTRNAKQNRLFKSLSDQNLILLIECLGIFFHVVTGPFWSMVISSKVSHTDFRSTILFLKDSLQKCTENPACIFDPDCFACLGKFGSTSSGTKEKFSKAIKNDEMGAVISAISKGMCEAIEAQLKDVLERPADVQVQAPLTNLVCERNFGHLDSSQRRRPHSSLHHHSSVIMLKKAAKRMKAYLETLGEQERSVLMKKARSDCKETRKKHQERDREAVMLSLKKNPQNEEMIKEDLTEGLMIAVACENAWYPALVQRPSQMGEDIEVSFSELGKSLGSFYWPSGKDVHIISRKSVVDINVDYIPQAGGRYWRVVNAQEIEKKFKKFQ